LRLTIYTGKQVSLRPGSASVAPGRLRLARSSPLSRPIAAHRASFGQLPVAAAEAASTRCLLFVRHLPVAGRFS